MICERNFLNIVLLTNQVFLFGYKIVKSNDMYFHHHHYDMPQKRLSDEKMNLIKELRKKGHTYRQIHKETGVSTGKISEICEKNRPITTINNLEKMVSTVNSRLFKFEKQFISVRDRLIEDVISAGKDYVCPNCSKEFMEFEESRKSFMRCPNCEYVVVFGKL